MNQIFINELNESLNNIDEVEYSTQDYVRNNITSLSNEFPMICFEYTSDSDFEVSIDESKFLNDEVHNGIWFMSEKFIVSLKEYDKNTLEIDVLEVNANMRNEGIGANVVSIIENIAEDYYKKIIISPFDTEAMNFWNHMEYYENNNCIWEKELDY